MIETVNIRALSLSLALAWSLLLQAQDTTERLWYQQPARRWKEALPLGNGRLGAMVFGRTEFEHLQLNEESLWAGEPTNPYPADVRAHYEKFQQLNLDGDYDAAMQYALKHLTAHPTSFRSYEPLGDLHLHFWGHSKAEQYERGLDLSTGIAQTRYLIDGQAFLREAFVSEKYDLIVFHFKSLDQQPVDCDIAYDRAKDIRVYSSGPGQLEAAGQIFDDPDGYDDNPGGSGPGGYHMKFHTKIAVLAQDGTYAPGSTHLRIRNAKSFTLLIGAATDYNPDNMDYDRSIDPAALVNQQFREAMVQDYSTIRSAHIANHQAVYNRLQLRIAPPGPDTLPTDERLSRLAEGAEDPYLAQVFFQYGRYLLMGSSGGRARLPANLQGVWNEEMWAPWEADYHLNINLQMNYWPAQVCRLEETVEPLTHWLGGLSQNGKETAKRFIGSDGWMAHHATNPFGRSTPSGSAPHSQIANGYCFPLAGAWMSLTLWRQYLFTLDEDYLRDSAYPLLKGAARFALDFLQENDRGELVTVPSYSPENEYLNPETGEAARNTIAAAIDIQIIRHLFQACLEAEQTLQQTELTAEIQAALPKLPPIRIGKDGTIQEWNEDYEEIEIGHRHISHLFALHPSNQITPKQPELFEAARKTIERRLSGGGAQTGWSRAWVINFFARLHDGEQAHFHLNELMAHQVSNNLFDIHPPDRFQIDGNFGATAGIAEMLIQSHEPNLIRLLPALPAAWPEGQVSGLKARGNFVVDMEWSEGELVSARITASKGGSTNLRYKTVEVPIELSAGESYVFQP